MSESQRRSGWLLILDDEPFVGPSCVYGHSLHKNTALKLLEMPRAWVSDICRGLRATPVVLNLWFE